MPSANIMNYKPESCYTAIANYRPAVRSTLDGNVAEERAGAILTEFDPGARWRVGPTATSAHRCPKRYRAVVECAFVYFIC